MTERKSYNIEKNETGVRRSKEETFTNRSYAIVRNVISCVSSIRYVSSFIDWTISPSLSLSFFLQYFCGFEGLSTR